MSDLQVPKLFYRRLLRYVHATLVATCVGRWITDTSLVFWSDFEDGYLTEQPMSDLAMIILQTSGLTIEHSSSSMLVGHFETEACFRLTEALRDCSHVDNLDFRTIRDQS